MTSPAIELTDVTKTYQLGDEVFHALNRVSLSIADGDSVAIMGPSGSGKTTLANVIGGLDRPDQGSVVVDGKDLTKLGDADLSHYRNEKVGFVFQAFNLKGDSSVLENVMLPLVFARAPSRERKARAAECLDKVGMSRRLQHLPNQLSGGERQRVAIARALVMRPKLIVADEPTGNLDSARGDEVIEILSNLNREGMTLVVITHDPHVASHARRVLEVRDGVVAEGVRS